MKRLLYSINEAAAVLSIGRTSTYKLINEGLLKTVTIGRRNLITKDSIDRLVDDPEDEP